MEANKNIFFGRWEPDFKFIFHNVFSTRELFKNMKKINSWYETFLIWSIKLSGFWLKAYQVIISRKENALKTNLNDSFPTKQVNI